jgi:hypothetical protein
MELVSVCGKRFKGRKGEDENPPNKKQRASFRDAVVDRTVDRTGTTGSSRARLLLCAPERILTKSTTESLSVPSSWRKKSLQVLNHPPTSQV